MVKSTQALPLIPTSQSYIENTVI